MQAPRSQTSAVAGGSAAPLSPAWPKLSAIEMRVGSEPRVVWLKMEADNPSGSVKHRTATSLVRQLELEGLLDEERVLVESTSGNLGVALAFIARERGFRFCAVVDPKVQRPLLARMRSLGAHVEMVRQKDAQGGYLQARIARVQQLLSSSSNFVWTNQYDSPTNPAPHAAATGPELWKQSGGAMDAVFLAVSTGGTLAGVSSYLQARAPHVRVIAVDAIGSSALGHALGARRLTGIGSSRTSSFVEPTMYETAILVSDEEAFAMCRGLKKALGISVGGSSGAVLAACSRYLREHPEIRNPVCLCADSGGSYRQTIFNDHWLAQQNLPSFPDQSHRFARC